MIASTYLPTLLLCGASIVVGEAVLRLCGYPSWSHLAPAVGLSTLVVTASGALWLPGHATTAGVILAVVTVAAAIGTLRRGRRPDLVSSVTALVVLAAVSIPFVVNRHVGVMGVSIDDDFAAHFTWADSLYNALPGTAIYAGYPLGPHALVTSFAHLLGASVEGPFNALLLGVPILIALTAQAALRQAATPARVLAGLVTGVPYLVAAHLVEGAFKELMMALIFLGFVLAIRQLRQSSEWGPRRAVPLGIMLAASALIYGRAGYAWPLGAACAWLVAEIAFARAIPSPATVRAGVRFIGALATVTVLCSLSETERLLRFHAPVLEGGNVATYTSPFQVLGVWFAGDFRVSPADPFVSGLLIGGVLTLAAYSLLWWLQHRDVALPAAVVSALVIYVVVRDHANPYISAKPLVIAAPAVMLLLLVPLLSSRRVGGVRAMSLGHVVALLGVAGLIGCGLWSSGLALRNGRVASYEHIEELSAARVITRGHPTLVLIPDNFAAWELRGAEVSSPTPYGSFPVVPFALRKPFTPQGTLDVDSIEPKELDRFTYLLTTTSHFASAMPANWHPVFSSRSYELWKRMGPTPARGILAEGNAPGAPLDCNTPIGRQLRATAGEAGLWTHAPVGPLDAWSVGPTPLTATPQGFVAVVTGTVLTQRIVLPPGRWELSLPYQSPAALFLIAGDLRAVVPSNLNLLGPYWRVGDVTSTGAPLGVTLTLQKMRFDAAHQLAAVGGLVAVRLPREVDTVPIRKACGGYVDWFTR